MLMLKSWVTVVTTKNKGMKVKGNKLFRLFTVHIVLLVFNFLDNRRSFSCIINYYLRYIFCSFPFSEQLLLRRDKL